jgi:DNA polymerase-3 subunit delta
VLNVARYDVDKLRAAMLEGDTARCARLLEGLKGEGVAPPLVLWAFASEIRTLARLRMGRTRAGRCSRLLQAPSASSTTAAPPPCSAPCRACAVAQLRTALLARRQHRPHDQGPGATGDVWDEFLQLALRLARKADGEE